jgi:xanthine dehydrogenase YagT iron-sulfur-binding subunit
MQKDGSHPFRPTNAQNEDNERFQQHDERSLHDAGVTRRDFVVTIGAVAGGVCMSTVPGLQPKVNATEAAAPTGQTVALNLRINGLRHVVSVDPRVTLLDLLRENLAFTGTKKGCDHGQCGACTVLANGRRINSCLSLAVVHDGEEITTIEGIAQGGSLHPVQSAFLEHDGFQCGYCTPGQICSAIALLEEQKRGDASFVTENLSVEGAPELTADEIRERMSGNLCRCGAYPGIVSAIQSLGQNAVKAGA